MTNDQPRIPNLQYPISVIACLAAAVILVLSACGQPISTAPPVYLRAAGSTAMGPLLAGLVTAFGRQAPAIGLEVMAEGSQFGLDSLRTGEAELAFVSWLPPGPDGPQLDAGWQATDVGRDGIAVVVHPSNPARGLGLLQLRDLFGGQAFEWSAVGMAVTPGEVQPVSREDGSGTRAAFEALAMEGTRVTPRAVVVTSGQEVVDYVATHPAAIGYVSAAFVSARVKVLSIEGELPTPEAVRSGSYPLSRDLWLVTASPPPPSVQQFLDFCLSPAGQEIVGQQYVRIR